MGSSKESYSPTAGNGHSNGANGANGTSDAQTKAPKPQRTKPKQQKKSGGSVVSNYMKLRTASRRPLPTDLGNGHYRQLTKRPGIGQDLRSLSREGEITDILHADDLPY
jgi:linoleate 10R-lipoxygenase